ncbi:MAG: hypothetical protein GKR91_17190 [Pseudomonadales bacterium]|nr:hypothetical protein [Pseudomonadales bacterium]
MRGNVSKSSTQISLSGFFASHLESVDESYFQHMRHALSFTVALFLGAILCLIHAFFPFLFEKSGSDIVRRLHERMVKNRKNLSRS